MFNKKEFEEFIGEITYLNESTKNLIKQIKEVDKKSMSLNEVLNKLETVSKSLNFKISKTLDENISKQLKEIVEQKVEKLVDRSNNLKDVSISIAQSVEFANRANRKIEKRQKYHIIESILYIFFFGIGLFVQYYFHLIK